MKAEAIQLIPRKLAANLELLIVSQTEKLCRISCKLYDVCTNQLSHAIAQTYLQFVPWIWNSFIFKATDNFLQIT